MSTFTLKDPNSIGVAFLGVGRIGPDPHPDPGRDRAMPGSSSSRTSTSAAAERGREIARARTGPRPTPLDAIGDPAVEAVVIVTPTSTHASLIEAALRAGKAIWSEKPIALDLAETEPRRRALARDRHPRPAGVHAPLRPGLRPGQGADRGGRARADRAVPGLLARHLPAAGRVHPRTAAGRSWT